MNNFFAFLALFAMSVASLTGLANGEDLYAALPITSATRPTVSAPNTVDASTRVKQTQSTFLNINHLARIADSIKEPPDKDPYSQGCCCPPVSRMT